jgi:NAD(P)-dependent dehydrogenase (short-subunit alcohol dehydrogenase family)
MPGQKGNLTRMDLRGKAALVTGGAVRLGAEICRALAGEGMHVVVHYNRSEQEALRLCDELARDHGVRAFAEQAALESESACTELVRSAAARTGSLDVLVNNASVFRKDRLPAVTEEGVLGEFWPNLFAPMFLLRAFAAQGGAAVVNLLDRRIDSVDPSCVPYLLTKKGLADLTRVAAVEYAPAIRVNGVAPGAVLPPPGEGPDYLKEQGGAALLDRACTPADVAGAVVFLLQGETLTGQTLYIDGGQHLICP